MILTNVYYKTTNYYCSSHDETYRQDLLYKTILSPLEPKSSIRRECAFDNTIAFTSNVCQFFMKYGANLP